MRPAGYDHADFPGSLRRLLGENTADLRAGRGPSRPMVGFWCAGLGFLDPTGRRVGCLLHPAVNQGRDLREVTGYRDKCARESCPAARAWRELSPGAREVLFAAWQGMESFAFSSPRLNPWRRVLALGPGVAELVAGLALAPGEPGGWPWLARLAPAWGWFLARLAREQGPALWREPELDRVVEQEALALARGLGPLPPVAGGETWHALAGEWEGRFWRRLTGRDRVLPEVWRRWRAAGDVPGAGTRTCQVGLKGVQK